MAASKSSLATAEAAACSTSSTALARAFLLGLLQQRWVRRLIVLAAVLLLLDAQDVARRA